MPNRSFFFSFLELWSKCTISDSRDVLQCTHHLFLGLTHHYQIKGTRTLSQISFTFLTYLESVGVFKSYLTLGLRTKKDKKEITMWRTKFI